MSFSQGPHSVVLGADARAGPEEGAVGAVIPAGVGGAMAGVGGAMATVGGAMAAGGGHLPPASP